MNLSQDEIGIVMAMLVVGDERETLLDAFSDEDSAIDAIGRLEFRGLIRGDSHSRMFFTSKGYDWLVANGHIDASLFTKALLTRPTSYGWRLTANGFKYMATVKYTPRKQGRVYRERGGPKG